MKKIFYLSTCDKCKRMLSALKNTDDFTFIDLKNGPIDPDSLHQIHRFTKSYEVLFNKRAKKYKDPVIKSKMISDEAFKTGILTEYTFLKRPIMIDGDKVYIENLPEI